MTISSTQPQSICIVGAGYVGKRFARQCQQNGNRVTIVSRSPDQIQFADCSHQVITMDWCDGSGNSALKQVGELDLLAITVSHAIGPSGENDHATGLANVLSKLLRPPKKLLYLSTTGVYASPDNGAWVCETDRCEPARSGSKNAFAAEQWLASAVTTYGPMQTTILRPAGIYGPQRIPNLKALADQTPISADPKSFLNLIHVDDLVSAMLAIANDSRLPKTQLEIYNVSDGNPPTRADYYNFIAQQIAAPPPIFAGNSPAATNQIKFRSSGNKRVSNQKLRQRYDLPFIAPDYKAGLSPLIVN